MNISFKEYKNAISDTFNVMCWSKTHKETIEYFSNIDENSMSAEEKLFKYAVLETSKVNERIEQLEKENKLCK